jgi:hypothetical protein
MRANCCIACDTSAQGRLERVLNTATRFLRSKNLKSPAWRAPTVQIQVEPVYPVS